VKPCKLVEMYRLFRDTCLPHAGGSKYVRNHGRKIPIYIYTGWSESLCAPDDYNTESYKQCSKCLSPVSRYLFTRRTVFWMTVFSITRSTFRMYSVMAIVRRTETFWSLCIHIHGYRIEHPNYQSPLFICVNPLVIISTHYLYVKHTLLLLNDMPRLVPPKRHFYASSWVTTYPVW
jgi:hypothetical protein